MSELYNAEYEKLMILKQAIEIGIHQVENNIFSEKSILDLIEDDKIFTNHNYK